MELSEIFQGFAYQKVENSSNVKAYGYDIFKEILRVQFKDGSVYNYNELPVSVAKAIQMAHKTGKSVGSFLHQKVYPFSKGVKVSSKEPGGGNG